MLTRHRKNFWQVHGRLGSGLCIKGSKLVGAGDGVFTNKTILPDTIITEYCGYKRRIKWKKTKGGISEKYHYSISDDSRTLVGIRTQSKLIGRGIGQLANDAISFGLNGIENNCSFHEEGGKVYLKAKRLIMAGEELLVDYGLQYWLGEIKKNPSLYSKKYQDWINLIDKTCNIWYRYKNMRVYKVKNMVNYPTGQKIILVLDDPVNVCCQFDKKLEIIIKKGYVVNLYCDECKSTINIGELY